MTMGLPFWSPQIFIFLCFLIGGVFIKTTENAISRTSFRYQQPYDYYNSDNYNNYYRDYYDRYYNRQRGGSRDYIYDRDRDYNRYDRYAPDYDRDRYNDRNRYDIDRYDRNRYDNRNRYDYRDRYDNRDRYDRDRYDRDRYNPDSGTRYIGPDTFPGKFLGNGKINLLYGGRDAELICTLNTAAEAVSNVVWSKIEGAYPYNSQQTPSFKDLDFDDYRMSHHMIQGSAVILIRDVRPTDFGVYRCVSTAIGNPGTGVDVKETVFQIIEFFRN